MTENLWWAVYSGFILGAFLGFLALSGRVDVAFAGSCTVVLGTTLGAMHPRLKRGEAARRSP